MRTKQENSEEKKSENEKMVEFYYKRIMRILEYYVLLCFIMITIIPLLNFSWVPAFIKMVYFTGFPLLILIFIISLFKEPIQKVFVGFLKK